MYRATLSDHTSTVHVQERYRISKSRHVSTTQENKEVTIDTLKGSQFYRFSLT